MPQCSGFLRGYLSGFLGQTVRASDERVIGSLICLEFDSQRCAKSKGKAGLFWVRNWVLSADSLCYCVKHSIMQWCIAVVFEFEAVF